MKKYIAVAAAIIIVGVAYLGYVQYEKSRLIDSITPHVKNISLRVVNSTRYETEADTKITFKELFEKLEVDIAEVDKRLIDVQTIASPKTAKLTGPVITYLKTSQDYLRALLQKYRKTMKVNIAMNWSDKTLDDLRNSSGYGFDFAKRSADTAIKELEVAGKEYEDSKVELRASTLKLKETRTAIASILPEDSLIPVAQLDAVISKYAPKPSSNESVK